MLLANKAEQRQMNPTEKTFTIRDIDGSNPREVTLAQFLAHHEERKAMAAPIAAALRAGDHDACERAQQAMRKRYPKG